MAPFYDGICQVRGPGAVERAPALVGVNVVRPVGRSTLTPLARRRDVAAMGPRGASGLLAVGVASGVRVREVADPKCRCPGEGRPRWMIEPPRSALPGRSGAVRPGGWRRR